IFTVMCYNVLCDKYATRQMYGYCPSWALEWEYRKKGILDEIRHYAADIISLQEVETSQFYNFFLPELKRDGYDGIFSPKSRAKTMAENERKFVDGCAIFYRTAKFSLIKEHLVEFNQLAMANAEGSDNMLNRVMPKDNIGLAALLKTKEAAWDNGCPARRAYLVFRSKESMCLVESSCCRKKLISRSFTINVEIHENYSYEVNGISNQNMNSCFIFTMPMDMGHSPHDKNLRNVLRSVDSGPSRSSMCLSY
ncbi:hypothetical protein L9F63_003750, partial [Diploptera punctata]